VRQACRWRMYHNVPKTLVWHSMLSGIRCRIRFYDIGETMIWLGIGIGIAGTILTGFALLLIGPILAYFWAIAKGYRG
jgi:hypothetical protein